MKTKLFLLSAAMFTILVTDSCTRESVPSQTTGNQEYRQIEIEAVMADGAGKTSVDDAGIVYWTPKDSISIFFGDYYVPFYSYNTVPSTTARFLGSVLISTASNETQSGSEEQYVYWGVYPYQTHDFQYNPIRVNDGVMCFVDENQSAAEGTFDKSTFVTVAKSDDYSKMAFYNVCGGIRFKLEASDIEMVTFCGNAGEELAGEVNVEMDEQGIPYVKSVYSGVRTVRLKAPAGECFKSGVWYYIVSLPATLSEGYTMKFISKTQNKMAEYIVSDAKTVKRSNFGSIINPDSGLQYGEYDGSEEETQMPASLSIKSMTPQPDTTFIFEIKYPTYSTQQLCDKVDMVAEENSYNTRSISESLFKVAYHITGDYTKYSKLSNEEQVKIQSLMTDGIAVYSYKSCKFLQFDYSSKWASLLSNNSVVRTYGDRTFLAYSGYYYSSSGSKRSTSMGEIVDREDELSTVDYPSLDCMNVTSVIDLWMSPDSCIMLCGYNYSSSPCSFSVAAVPSTQEVNCTSMECYSEPAVLQAGEARFVLSSSEESYPSNRIHFISEQGGEPQLNKVFESDTVYFTGKSVALGTETVAPLYNGYYSTSYSDYVKLYESGEAKRFTFERPYEKDTDTTYFSLLEYDNYDGKTCVYALSCKCKYSRATRLYTDFKLYEISYVSDTQTICPLGNSIPDCENVHCWGQDGSPYFTIDLEIGGENKTLYLNCNTREVTSEDPQSSTGGGDTK